MNSESPLIELIRSMKPSEKRQFKLRSTASGHSPSYLRLYDFLVAHPVGDDAAIRQEFAGEPFMRQLPVAKNYLFHQILDTLYAYDSGKSPSLSLAHRLAEVELLFRRGLHVAALDQALQGAKQAQSLDLPLKELEFLRWHMRLCRILGGGGLMERLRALHAQERRVLGSIQHEQELIELHDEAYGLLLTRASLAPAELEARCAAIFAHPLLDDAAYPERNFDAKMMVGYIRVWAHSLTADHLGQWLAHRQMLEVWQARKHRMRLEPERYLRTLSGYLQSGLNASKLDDAPATIAKMRRLLKLHTELQATDGFRVYFAEWTYLMNQYMVREASQVVPELLAAIAQNPKITPQVSASVMANLAIMWFQLQRWEACKDQIESLLRKYGSFVPRPLTLLMRLLRTLCTLEQAEFEQAARQIRALQAELVRIDDAPTDLLQWIETLGTACQSLLRSNPTDAFHELQTQLTTEGMRSLPHHRVLQAWVHQRLHGTRILDYLRAQDGK